MKSLDASPEAVFRKLTDGLVRIGDCRKVDDTLTVEVVDQTTLGLLVSMARYDEQPNGDRLRGTSMPSSSKTDDGMFTLSYRRESVAWQISGC